jgi:O-antigen/teichoic acid export membrane protein
MAVLANRAAMLTLARLANYGLMLISPVVLVRLLSVEDFGRYREFLLYASILQAVSAFAISDSLLYFIPAHPRSPWRTVRQTAMLTACASVLVMTGLVICDILTQGQVLSGFRWALAAYILLSVNLDFWEFYWLANHRAVAMFLYSAGRLIVRMIVVVTAAALTRDIEVIIWSLVVLEGVRLIGSAVVWTRLDRASQEPPLAEPWRDQMRFCLPSGVSALLAHLNRNLSSLGVARLLGAPALAQFAIARFGEPVVVALRNSVSTVVLPEMVRRGRESREGPLALWRRATVVNAILLFPVAVLVTRYAEPLVTTVFGAAYLQAAAVMQIYMLVVIRETVDFAAALRAANRTSALVYGSIAGLVTCAIALIILIPMFGLKGAMGAFALSTFVDAVYQGYWVARVHGVGIRDVLPWSSIARTALAAALAAAVLAPFWTDTLGFAGIFVASAVYLALFAALLKVGRVPEASAVFGWLRRHMALRATS